MSTPENLIDEINRQISMGKDYETLKTIFDPSNPTVASELEKVRRIEQARVTSEQAKSEFDIKPLNKVNAPNIPDYEIIRPVGEGGFGVVWLGKNIHDNCYYAVKVLHAGRESDLDGVKEFRRVADGRTNLMPILHVGQTQDEYYYVMPLADDAFHTNSVVSPDSYIPLTLSTCLSRPIRIQVDVVHSAAIDLITSIMQLHRIGAIHRDVKPSNVMRLNGRWHLADPGLITSDTSSDLGGTADFSPIDSNNDASTDLFGFGRTIRLLCEHQQCDSSVFNANDWKRRRILAIAKRASHPEANCRFSSAQAIYRRLEPSMQGKLISLTAIGLGLSVFLFGAWLILR